MEFPGFFVCPECKPVAVAKLARGEMIGTIWRKGKSLVMRRDAVFPDRCVYCNDSANGYRLKRTYYWHHPALYLLILTPFAPLILYIIVALFARKSVTMAIPLCRRHHRRLVLRRLIALGGFYSVPGLLGGRAQLHQWIIGGFGSANLPRCLGRCRVCRSRFRSDSNRRDSGGPLWHRFGISGGVSGMAASISHAQHPMPHALERGTRVWCFAGPAPHLRNEATTIRAGLAI